MIIYHWYMVIPDLISARHNTNMTTTNYRGKARAVFLAAIMVTSIMGGSVAFAGSAAAVNADSLDLDSFESGTDLVVQSGNLNNITVDDAGGTDGTPGMQVYVDENNNSQFDLGEANASNSTTYTDGEREIAIDSLSTPSSDGEYTVYAFENETLNDGDNTNTDSATLTVDNTAPSVSDVELSDDTDDNGIVADDDSVTISANVTDANTISNVEADASSFGAGIVTLTQQTGDTYTETINVTGASADEGDQTVNVTATDEADNTNEAAIESTSLNVDTSAADTNVIDVGNEEENIQQSDDDLQIIYENIDANTESATITLDRVDQGGDAGLSGETYTYNIDDSANIDNSQKAITLDLINQIDSITPGLDDSGNLYDDSYDITVETTDAAGNSTSDSTTTAPLVINDDIPSVTIDDIAGRVPQNVGPSDTIDIQYTYEDATNASSVDVDLYDSVESQLIGEDRYVATVELNVDHESGTETQSVDLSSAVDKNDNDAPVSIDGNNVYDVQVTATDSQGQFNSDRNDESLVVNQNAPSIDGVQADAGLDQITVTFTEGVESDDGALDVTDFTYQNASGTGASSIDSVSHEAGSSVAVLTLDAPVSADDLSTDAVSVRQGEVSDTAPLDYDLTVDSGVTETLEDNQGPSASITAADISQDNENNEYAVTVNTQKSNELVDVTLTIANDSGTDISASQDDVQDSVTFSNLDVSGISDGDVTIETEVTDKGGTTFATDTTVTKDTVSPEIDSVETNAGTNTVTVTFTKDISFAQTTDFDVQGAPDVNTINNGGSDDTVVLTLEDDVPFDAINDSSVANITATGVTDTVAGGSGNPAVADPVALGDGTSPSISGAEAEVNSDEVEVAFSESVVNASGDTLDADDFSYENDSDAAPTEVVSVDHDAESSTATLTLDAAVNSDALANDSISIAANVVYDADDNTAGAQTISINDGIAPTIDVSTDVDGSTITYTIGSNEELESIDHDITTANTLTQTQIRPEAETPGAELTIDDFEFDDSGSEYNYTASFDAPRDGAYEGSLSVTDFDDNVAGGFVVDDVDTSDASVDASYLNGDASENTVWVFFDEPVDASDIDTSDVTINGQDVNAVLDNNNGEVRQLIVQSDADNLQTGDEPSVEVAGGSFDEITNDSSAGQTSSATVDTAWYTVQEGANFLSVPALSGGQSLNDLDTSSVNVIWTYDNGEWQSYDPDADDNDFDTLQGGQGYIVDASGADTLELNVYNQEASSTGDVDGALLNQQQLNEGWNLVGHYQTFGQDADVGLSSIDSDVHLVYGQASGYTYERVDYDTGELTPGEAYWTFVTDDTVYTFSPN